MALKEYLEVQMAQQDITAKEIERRSKGKITDTHIAYIRSGKSKNPTVRIIMGLAEGLGVDPVEVFKIATGLETHQPLWTPRALVRTVDEIVDNTELGKLVQLLMKQKPAKIKRLLKSLESE